MDDNPLQTASRVILGMFGIGLGIALAAVLVTEWVNATIVPNLGAGEEEAVTTVVPLGFAAISILGAPIIAGIFGISEGTRSSTTRDAAIVGGACFLGTILMIFVAVAGVAVADTNVPDVQENNDAQADTPANGGQANDSTDAGNNSGAESEGGNTLPGPLDLVGLTGLCGASALVAGFATARFAAN